VQNALPVMLEARKTIQYQLLGRIEQNLSDLDKLLKAQTACSRLDVEGGWYAVLRVPATCTDEELAIDLIEKERILVHPGHFYNFRGDGYVVVSLIVLPAEFHDGIGRMLRHLMPTRVTI
jgi:aspartate/methionine/tyrosine aminotransferase